MLLYQVGPNSQLLLSAKRSLRPDSQFSPAADPNPPKAGYLLLLGYLVLCGQRMDMLASQTPELRGRTHALGAAGSAAVAIVLSIGHAMMVSAVAAAQSKPRTYNVLV
jgi:hypothetical protein